MDIQRAIICKTVQERALTDLVEAGIKESFFPSPEHAMAYRWMIEYYQQYGDPPTPKAFKNNFPTYNLVRIEEPLLFLIDQLRAQKKMALIEETTMGVVEKRNDDETPDDILKYIATQINEIHTEVSELKDVDMITTWQSRLEHYEAMMNMPNELQGIPMGFPKIDQVLSGLQGGQLVTIIGEPKVGKSTLCLRCAINAHEYGAPVCFIGFEMTNQEQTTRADSMRTRISHERLMQGKLSDKELRKMAKELARIEEEFPHPFILSQDVYSATTLSGVLAKVQRHRPSVLFVDGVYLMDDEKGEKQGSPQHLTNMTRGFKRMAQQLDIPIVITTQALTWKMGSWGGKKKALTADAIGYSSSFAQDSDLIIGIEHIAEYDDLKKVSTLLSRNTRNVSLTIRWDWAIGEFTETDDPDEYNEEDDDGFANPD